MHRNPIAKLLSLVAAPIAAASIAGAQGAPVGTEPGAPLLAITKVPVLGTPATLTVTSPSFQPGADIPMWATQWETNTFPGLTWTPGPEGTKSYVIIMQDPDAIDMGRPIVHWTAFNIAGTRLDSAMAAAPAGVVYGPNFKGEAQAYAGPRTPPGPKHRYHFQVFALNHTLPADAAKNYDALIEAMKWFVVAKGEVVGLGSAPANSSLASTPPQD
jgi:Raf kinase inhibitor-like YbhB/YbcL family protein